MNTTIDNKEKITETTKSGFSIKEARFYNSIISLKVVVASARYKDRQVALELVRKTNGWGDTLKMHFKRGYRLNLAEHPALDNRTGPDFVAFLTPYEVQDVLAILDKNSEEDLDFLFDASTALFSITKNGKTFDFPLTFRHYTCLHFKKDIVASFRGAYRALGADEVVLDFENDKLTLTAKKDGKKIVAEDTMEVRTFWGAKGTISMPAWFFESSLGGLTEDDVFLSWSKHADERDYYKFSNKKNYIDWHEKDRRN